ncbi:Serine/arginine-rich splicing factor 33 [Dendrobium catenatum]|uniref:Eukaryotic translation initiation factor 3 subunit G n=1 Tax=Dendrobium catenatum TaxID=906689 RepID=A0A2I0VX93_9ASPA|nr:Serine/arginine-rich splicing factor 33 [Dendrobium catenatum]
MAADVGRVPASKLRWGELEDDVEDMDFFLPPRIVIGPDENGLKKVIEDKFNDDGKKVKVTTTIQIRKLARARLSKRALERRAWAKFGDAAHEDASSRLTMVSTEEIILERPRAPGEKDLAQPIDSSIDKPPTAETSTGAAGKNTYVPPGMRAGADRGGGSEMRRRNDENSVRVTNLSEDTREPDLHELFRTFGPVSRVYVAVDQKTGVSRGFGFVNFVHREDAEKAINKLNGYGYDNLILRVEWATPRPN